MESTDQKTTALAPIVQQPGGSVSVFAPANFEQAQRVAVALCSSDLVPEAYRGREKIGSALLALDIANRVGVSPLMVMQNLNIIHGRPSWSSAYIIATLNSCGRFSPLRFKVTGSGDAQQCVAAAVDRSSGEILEGPPASIGMAKAEGWYSRNGSKWKTMPDLMLRYRAAAFFGRLYAPDVLMGMHASDEVEDIVDVTPRSAAPALVEPGAQPEPPKKVEGEVIPKRRREKVEPKATQAPEQDPTPPAAPQLAQPQQDAEKPKDTDLF